MYSILYSRLYFFFTLTCVRLTVRESFSLTLLLNIAFFFYLPSSSLISVANECTVCACDELDKSGTRQHKVNIIIRLQRAQIRKEDSRNLDSKSFIPVMWHCQGYHAWLDTYVMLISSYPPNTFFSHSPPNRSIKICKNSVTAVSLVFFLWRERWRSDMDIYYKI